MSPNRSEAAEAAARIFRIDSLARKQISRDVTTSVRTRPSDGQVVYTVSRPVGAGREVVAYGDYDEMIVQLTRRRVILTDPAEEEQTP